MEQRRGHGTAAGERVSARTVRLAVPIKCHHHMSDISRQPRVVSFDCGVFTCAFLLHLAMGYAGEMPFTQVKVTY